MFALFGGMKAHHRGYHRDQTIAGVVAAIASRGPGRASGERGDG